MDYTLKCQSCGKDFTSQRSDTLTCSPACRQRRARAYHRSTGKGPTYGNTKRLPIGNDLAASRRRAPAPIPPAGRRAAPKAKPSKPAQVPTDEKPKPVEVKKSLPEPTAPVPEPEKPARPKRRRKGRSAV